MPITKVQIISFAIAKLGNKPISSLENQSDIVNAAVQAFDILLPIILSEQTWRFACKIQQVSQLVTEPIIDNWRYIYELPGDYLKMIRQWPHNYSYEIYENRHMYSNVNGPLYIEYMFEPSVFQLPAHFYNYLSLKIAEHLALSNGHNVEFSKKLGADSDSARATALAADAQSRPQSPLASQPIISNRAIGYAPYGGGYNG